MVHLPEEGATEVDVVLVLDAGSGWDPPGREGTAFRAAGARTERTPRGSRAAVHVGKEWVVYGARCAAPGSWCREALATWMLPVQADEVGSSAVDADAHRALTSVSASELARWVEDAWVFDGLPTAWPPAGRLDLSAQLRADEIVAWDRSRAVRASAVVGLAGPTSAADLAEAAASSRSLPARVGPVPVRPDPVPSSGRMALVVPGPSVSWRAVGEASADDPLAVAVALSALDPDPDPDPCTTTDGWPAPWDRPRRAVMSVGGASTEDGLVGELIAWESGLGALRAPRAGAEAAVVQGRQRVEAKARADLADPSCQLASTAVAVALGRPEPAATALAGLDDVDVARVSAVLAEGMTTEDLRYVVTAPDPVRMAARLEAAAPLRLDGVEVRQAVPWGRPP